MASLRTLLLAVLLVFVPLAHAGEAAPAADDPALEKRVNVLAETLRCLVCQNQTIADSHADLAVDLKNQIREKLRQGMTEKQIVDFMVQRYGDFVLYNPPVKSTTWLLWFGPFVLLVVGLAVLFLKLRQRSLQVRDAPLSAAEHARAQALLDGQDQREQP